MFATFLDRTCTLALFMVVCAPFVLRSLDRPTPTRPAATEAPLGRDLVCKVVIANVASVSEAHRVQSRYAALSARLRTAGTVAGDARQRARAIHEFIHADILRGQYDSAASELSAALAGGPFNCAASSALFLALARDFDLEVRAVSVTGHVWCRVHASEGSFDVETTCSDWFVLTERRASDDSAEPAAFWKEHDARAARGRTLDEPEFLAIFHFNRGVRLFRARKFAAAAAANRAALALDPACSPAADNLRASLRHESLGQASAGPK